MHTFIYILTQAINLYIFRFLEKVYFILRQIITNKHEFQQFLDQN